MKISVNEIGGAVTRDDGVLSLGVKDQSGNTHTIEFSAQSQETLTLALLASSPDPLGPVARRFRPGGLGRFQVDNEIGLSFFLTREIAIHLTLTRTLANYLEKRILATFDDPSTWDATFDTSKKPN